ncbi:MAG: glycosyltransferase [Leadbetterella sp.]|nr:glycosyltransferase [Leadbetterella sp.]
MSLAPIVIFCYNRREHLENTVDALALNPLAKDSDLIVYSDGPRRETDTEKITDLRAYLATVTGFRSVTVHARKENMGLARSIITGVSEVLNSYGKAIILEDDLLSTPDFLAYMNDALRVFEENPLVFSVSGYSFGIGAVKEYSQDTALVFRASSLGWGTWKDRWEKVDWQVSDFPEFMSSPERQDSLKNAGEDILPMIIKQQRGLINSWAVRWTYHHVKYGGYCLIPVRSKIKTIGDDGSGSNPVAATLHQDLGYGESPVRLNPDILPDPAITRFIRRNNRPSLYRRIINRWKFGVW